MDAQARGGQEPQQRKVARRRRWPWVVALLLFPVLVLGALVLWSRTEHALATTVRLLERASDGRIALSGVAGTLYGPITVQRLVVRDAGNEVIVETLALDWSPQALLGATLRVDRLTADALTVKLASGSAAAAAPPATLRVPVRVALHDLRIARVTVDDGSTPLELAPLAGALTLGLTRHTLRLRELGTPWTQVSGELTIGAWAPFQLEGRATLGAIATLPLNGAELAFSGRLSRVSIALAPKARWLKGEAAAVVAPFEASPLQVLSAALSEVDLAGLDAALPATRATLEARLTARDGVLSGPVSASNTLAGPIDAGRVPLSAARAMAGFDGARLRLDALKLTLADAGDASGWAEIAPAGITLELASDGVRLDQLHGALRPLRPAGTVRMTGSGDLQRFDAKLTEGEYALALTAKRQAERVDVESATLRMPGGEVTARGQLLLNDARAFTLSARLKEFDPAQFVAMPAARLNGALEAKGMLQPEWRAEITTRIADSSFAGAPLSGEGSVTATAERLAVQSARLAVGGNRARAEGRLGAAGDRLELNIDAPALAQLGLGANGALRLNGWIGGSRANPAFAIEARGRDLKFRELSAATLSLTGNAPQGLTGKVRAQGEIRGARAAGRSLARVEVTLEGTRQRHTLDATIDDPALAASLRAQGGLSESGGWDGRIETLQASRPYGTRLVEPVALRVRPGRLEAAAGRLALAGGELRFEQLVAGAGALTTRGRIERIALAGLLAPPGPVAAFRTDLVVSGAWDIRATDTLSGSLQLARDSGDVVLSGSTPLPLEVRELRLDATANANVIEATLRGEGDKLGALSVDLRTTAERGAGAWQISPEAPLALRARFTIPSLAWLGRLLNAELRTDGSVSGQMAVDGTLREPRLQGELNGEKLRVRYGSAGVRLRDGEMKIELAQDKVIFRRIAFRGDEGTLTASGEASLAGGQPQLDLEFQADKLAAVRRDDQQLALSGSGHVRSRDGKLALEGSFTADRGLIELRAENAPRLSSDVVIVSDAPKEAAAPARLKLDVTLDLGDAFTVKGEGLDVRMAGAVRVTLEEGESRMHARGSVRVVEGHYAVYGQRLNIARGALLFDGPLDNPKLDILAVRKNQRVEAGVLITGTALSPRTALYSNPPVPDSQKLQWLVFGAGPGAAGDAEFGLAGTTQQRNQFASVGAQLASAVYVSVGQSLRNSDSFVQATLDLTQRIAVQGRTGSENAVTLIYTWEFD